MRVPWAARRSNQSTLKEINPEYSLEGLMVKLKLQYFGHLMRRADLLEKTLMLGKIEGRRRRGRQRMRWLDGITNLMDVSLSNLQKAWCPARGRKELDTKTNKTPGANVGILGHESNCCPPPVHGPSGLYLQLPPGGSRGREGAQGHRKGLRFEKTQGVGAGAGGTGLGPGQCRPREEENFSWVTGREGSPWLWVVVLVRNVLKPASPRTFIQNRRKHISPAWLQDQPGIQGASTPPEPEQ